jgi:hypothetical protein
MRTIKRKARLYWLAIIGKSYACGDAFDGFRHAAHEWVTLDGERTYRCGGWR